MFYSKHYSEHVTKMQLVGIVLYEDSLKTSFVLCRPRNIIGTSEIMERINMKYVTVKEAAEKWNISERRVRTLCDEGRISGAFRMGWIWSIPETAEKPIDARTTRHKLKNEEIRLNPMSFEAIDTKKRTLESHRPLPKNTLRSLRESTLLEWTYHSNAIEGNTLTISETKVVLEGITIGGKTMREHLEVINHRDAILFLEELVKSDQPLSEWNIKKLHRLILKNIDDENAGAYRTENVLISGAKHRSPDLLWITLWIPYPVFVYFTFGTEGPTVAFIV